MGSRTEDLAAELKLVIRLAGRDPEGLEGALPVLCALQRVSSAAAADESSRLHFVLHRLIPEYVDRLPAGRDCRAIRELLTWEDADGELRSLTTRYHRASAHLVNAASDFGRRQEPRLLLECARRFQALDHEDRLLATETAGLDSAGAGVGEDPGVSPLAPVLYEREKLEHERRLTAIRGGIFSVNNQEEMLELLLTMTQAARRTLHAVDRTDLERWFGNARMQSYLDAQLDRARGGEIRVERLRFIRPSRLEEPFQRNLLREFIRLHDEAGATLLLYPVGERSDLETGFDARMFMVLVDVDSAPACLTGWLGETGYIERSLVYLRELDPVRKHYADMQRVKEHVRLHRYNERIRGFLAAHDDPPISGDDRIAQPWWGPLAAPE